MRPDVFLLIVGLGLATYLTRAPFFLLFSEREFSPRMERLLRHVPIALLSALVIPTILLPAGTAHGTPTASYLVGTAVSLVVLRFSRNIILVVLGGVLAVALFRAATGRL